MKKIICGFTALLLLVALCSCGSNGRVPENLIGTWQTTERFNAERNTNFLKSFGFFDEEIELLNDIKFAAAKDFTLAKGGESDIYSFKYNEQRTREITKETFDKVFEKTFEGRETLSSIYRSNVETIKDVDKWKEYQSKNYGYSSYDEMIEDFVNCTITEYFGSDFFSKNLEEGTITVTEDKLITLPSGKEEKEEVAYSYKDGTMTLTYSNATEIYKK